AKRGCYLTRHQRGAPRVIGRDPARWFDRGLWLTFISFSTLSGGPHARVRVFKQAIQRGRSSFFSISWAERPKARSDVFSISPFNPDLRTETGRWFGWTISFLHVMVSPSTTLCSSPMLSYWFSRSTAICRKA